VRHTSEEEIGQIYVPAVNWLLFLAVTGLVLGFGSSERLASAYGVAVTGTFITTTILFLAVAHWQWRWPAWKLWLAGAVFLSVEVTFFAANLTKVLHGGWLPLVIGVGVSTVLLTWQRGQQIVTANRIEEEGPLRAFIDELREASPPVVRVHGTAVFPNASIETTPLAMRANVEHNHVLHQSVVIISVRSVGVPHVPPSERVTIDDLGYRDDGIAHVSARFGFQDEPNIPEALRLARDKGLERDVDLVNPSYFLSRITIRPTDAPGMSRWRKKLFVGLARNAASPAEYFSLPIDRTVTMGSTIPL
jgi:KUP system potassium uptake protein